MSTVNPTFQLTITDDMQRQIELLCEKPDDPRQREAILRAAMEYGLLNLSEEANRVHREFLEQWFIPSTSHFRRLRESRRVTIATSNGNDVNSPASGDSNERKPITLPRRFGER